MAEFRGNLYIFVDVLDDRGDAPATAESGDVFSLRNPGDLIWFNFGWAVGNNARGQNCARTSPSKLRAFPAFIDAVDLVRKKRKTRPAETFYLVYELDGRRSIVTSLEQIQELDGRLDEFADSARGEPADNPALSVLTEKVGKIVASNALLLLRTLLQEGEAAARARFSLATYDRLWQVLQQAALVEEGVVYEGAKFHSP